jgi:RNA polymerase sigma-70 factor (ECF subfamily)
MSDKELEALRRLGFGVAYRMLGSVSEAEDVAQEALLRLTRQDAPIDEPAASVTTVTTRLSINVLRSARARREAYVGPWLPEPLLEDPAPGPASRAELADSLSLALLVLLERLTPVERAATCCARCSATSTRRSRIIEQTEGTRGSSTRAAASRGHRPRFDPTRPPVRLLEAFPGGRRGGRPRGLEELLAKDASCTPTAAARRAPRSRSSAVVIARFMAAVSQARPASDDFENRRVRVNGQPGRMLRGPAERPLGEAERLAAEKAFAVMQSGDVDAKQLAELVKDARAARGGATPEQAEIRVWSVLTVDVVEGRIQTVRIVRNPDKLAHL